MLNTLDTVDWHANRSLAEDELGRCYCIVITDSFSCALAMEEEVHWITITAEKLAVGPSYFVGNCHSFLSFVKRLITAAMMDIVAIKVVGPAGKTRKLYSNYY
jgi:hypothetical protein